MTLPCYLDSIYIFSSCKGYEDDIFKVISKLHVQESKIGAKIYKLWVFFCISAYTALVMCSIITMALDSLAGPIILQYTALH